jgi:putative DNA primase/helicase
MNLSLHDAAKALGGEVSGDQIKCPGPGHSTKDRSLSIKFDRAAPDGILVHSFTSDDPIACKDYVRKKLGLAPFQPGSGNGHDKARPAVRPAPKEELRPFEIMPPRVPANSAIPKLPTELRRHIRYAEGPDGPIQAEVKIKRAGGSWVQWFNVGGQWTTGAGAKPKGWPTLIYTSPGLNPFDPELKDDDLCWPEGERDVDTLAEQGVPAFTFGGKSCPIAKDLDRYVAGRRIVVLADNDDHGGPKHAQDKAARAIAAGAAAVKVVMFDQKDVTDFFIAGHGTVEQLHQRIDAVPWRQRNEAESKPQPDTGAGAEQKEQPQKARAAVTLHSIVASSVEIRAITWLWVNRFAIGAFGIVAGLPDEGKGQVIAFIVAMVTTGGAWPIREGTAPKGSAIVFSAEENINDTLVPRLKAAGADLGRVHIIQLAKDKNGERMFSLLTDLPALRQKITDIGDVKFVSIDPVGSYLGVGKVDSFRGNDVRGVLMPLKTLAEEIQVAIIGVMHFNKKIDVTNALLRISDSLAFGAVARHVYGVIDDAENERKLLVRAKNNASPKSKDKTLGYHFGARPVGTDTRTGMEIWAPYIEWEPNYIDVTSAEAMQAAVDNKSPAAMDEAVKFLENILAKGPVLKEEIEEAAEANSITERTLWRAKTKLKIKAGKERGKTHGKWTWELPPAEPQSGHWTD